MRILICEDSVLLREGLVRLLEHSGHETVALPTTDGVIDTVHAGQGMRAGQSMDTTQAPTPEQIDLCILDVRLPPTFTNEGIRLALELRRLYPGMPLLVLSQYVEERYASDLIAEPGGGLGYLLKDRVADVAEFTASLEQIAAGGTVFDPEVVSQLLTRRRRDDRMQSLTSRESTVLAAIAEGRSNQAIAALLHLSEASVEKYITTIFQKLGLTQDEQGNRRVLAAIAHLESTED